MHVLSFPGVEELVLYPESQNPEAKEVKSETTDSKLRWTKEAFKSKRTPFQSTGRIWVPQTALGT